MEKVFLSRALSSRRQFLGGAGAATLALASAPALAETTVKLPLPGGPDERPITTAFPQKGALILQRTRPPLLETPLEVFDQSVFTPNDRFYVRWHWEVIPTAVDVDTFRLTVHGYVNQTLSLSLDDILALPRVELVAVNQCSGNSRGYFQPRVSGAQWSHGAMGNARWTGVPLKRRARPRGREGRRRPGSFQGLGRAGGPGRSEIHEVARDRSCPRRRGHARLCDERGTASVCSTASRSASSCRAGTRPTGSRCSTTSRCSTGRIRISGWRRRTRSPIRPAPTCSPDKPASDRCRSTGWFRAP